MRLYHLTSSTHALNALALQRLKIATFGDLNDPFELLAATMEEIAFRRAMRAWKADMQKKFGLLCFSQDWKSPVPWSHYAEKHRGICLGFDVKDHLVNQVKYIAERMHVEFEGNDPSKGLTQSFLDKLVRTKYEHWSYESEYRLFVNLDDKTLEGNLYFYPFSEDLILKEVILGPECDLPLDQVRMLVNSTYDAVSVFKARLAFKYFSVVPDERTFQSQK